jgi:hypothetical protein
MPRETLTDLRDRIAELENRNDALATRLDTLAIENASLAAAPPAPPIIVVPPAIPSAPRRPPGFLGRQILAGILVVLGVILTPVALVLQFAQQQISDTDAFVAAYAPLAESPAVQAAIADAVVNAVNENIDLDAITSGIIAGIQAADPTGLSGALNLARGPIVDGINSAIRWGVESVVTSEWFPTVWESCLRLTHSQLNAVLRGDENAVATIRGDDIALQLGPVIGLLKEQLVANDISFANLIPDNLSIEVPLGTVTGIGQIKTFYAVGLAVGTWLPLLAAAFLIGGIAVAPRRRNWVMGTSIALGLLAIVIGVVLSIGRSAVTSVGVMSPDALGFIFDAATATLGAMLLAMGAIAVIGIFAAWLAGPWRPARATRRAFDYYPAMGRARLALTNPFSRFLERYRELTYWVVIGAVVVTVVFWRPINIGVVIVAAILGAIVVLAAETFRSSTAPDPVGASPVEAAEAEASISG